MTTNNEANQGNSTALTVRQERMLAMRDEMAPGARPAAIVPRTFAEAHAMCSALAKSGLVPSSYRDAPENMIVTVMAGAEIGLPPMASLRLYHVMDNVPRLSAEGIRAVMMSRNDVIEYFEVVTCDDKHATWVGKRIGRPEKSTTWTIERAKRAGLTERKNRDGSPGNWMKYPEDMLNARASMQLARLIAPDIVAGMVSREEASDGDFIEATATETRSSGFQAPPAPDVKLVAGGPFVASGGTGSNAMPPPTSTNPPSGPPPGVPAPPAEPPKRGPGRPPKDPNARPTTPPPSSNSSDGGASASATPPAATPSPSISSTAASPSTASTSSATSSASNSNAGGSDKFTQAVQAVTDKAASAANPTASAGGGPAVESSAAPTSEAVSGASTDSDDGDGFGSEDPVDSQPVDEVDAKMAEFRAWVAGCKTQTELRAGLPGWQAWTRERSDKHSDLRFRKQGELTIAMQDAYGKRKGEVPA